MLVLSRRKDQQIVIPGLDMTIKVLRCKSSGVTLGFDAPPEIRIVRDELDSGFEIGDSCLDDFIQEKVSSLPKSKRHAFRDQINVLLMALQTVLEDIEDGELSQTEDIFECIQQRLNKVQSSQDDDDAFVLVVEDQPNERELLASILRMKGYRVATASDGVEALDYLATNGKPSFVLVDMELPRCNGAQLIEKIRETTELSDIRVYVVSGSDRDDCDVSDESVDGWYTKPLRPVELLNAMSMS